MAASDEEIHENGLEEDCNRSLDRCLCDMPTSAQHPDYNGTPIVFYDPRSVTAVQGRPNSLFNGTGVPKNEAAAGPYLRRAAQSGSPIAQSRLAFMYATGRGMPANAVEAAKWYLIAKAGGAKDQFLDDFLLKLKPEDRTAAEQAAKPYLALIAQRRP